MDKKKWGNLTHEEMLSRIPNKIKTPEGHIKIENLIIPDWEKHVKNYESIKDITEINKNIYIPTTFVRARVDLILLLGIFLKSNGEIIYIGKKEEVKMYNLLKTKFKNNETIVIPWGGHGFKIGKSNKLPSKKRPKQTVKMIEIVSDIGKKYN